MPSSASSGALATGTGPWPTWLAGSSPPPRFSGRTAWLPPPVCRAAGGILVDVSHMSLGSRRPGYYGHEADRPIAGGSAFCASGGARHLGLHRRSAADGAVAGLAYRHRLLRRRLPGLGGARRVAVAAYR